MGTRPREPYTQRLVRAYSRPSMHRLALHPRRTPVRLILASAWIATGGWAAASMAYLLGILTSAALGVRSLTTPAHDGAADLLVLVPAHDEELVLAATVRALLGTDYPAELRAVVVIADNCTDGTADVARDAGAVVWERQDPAHPGKGAALGWAITRAWKERPDLDAVLVVDADCIASPSLLSAVASRLRAGAAAIQVDYVAGNPQDSPSAALRYAAFLLMNTVRPLGKAGLGLSAGLLGTGMAFSRETLRRVPWGALSVTEDREYHLRLIEHGIRVEFAAEARVTTPVPVTVSQGAAQQMRWDTGNALLTRQWLRRLTVAGLRRRDRHLLHAAGELAVPPQATLVALTSIGLLIACLRRSRPLKLLTCATGAAQILYVVVGVSLVGSPRVLWRVLPAIPQLVLVRIRQQARIVIGRGSTTFVRTERSA